MVKPRRIKGFAGVSAISASSTDSHQDQVTRLEAQVQALTNQLRHAQRLATIGTVAAMVAHEFNNILTPILNYATLAKRNPSLTDKALTHAATGGARAAAASCRCPTTARGSPRRICR